MRDRNGFTLVEVAVAGGLVAVGLMAMVTIMERQNRSVGSMQNQLNLRQIQNSAIGLFLSSANNFPAAVPNSGSGAAATSATPPFTFVGCYASSQLLIANCTGNTGFVGVSGISQAIGNLTIPSGYCDYTGSYAQVEVHVQRIFPSSSSSATSIQFYSIYLPPLEGGSSLLPAAGCPTGLPYTIPRTGPRNYYDPGYLAQAVKVAQDSIDLGGPGSTPP